ncbi:YHYH domain-containing protein [Paenibacillus alvei]|uniref:YHYH domain-containing protein n=2 Tax=Paenibacillus TaxID=44249 RepID=UPI002DDD0652|nr:YHYH domain-containing protein [Paenibacillus alvei]
MIHDTYAKREEHITMTTSRWSKMIAVSTACIITLTSLTSVASGHPGRTDAKGGHTCKTNCAKWGLKNGEYHYHHGSSSSSSKKSGSSKSSSPKKSKSTKSTKSKKSSKNK